MYDLYLASDKLSRSLLIDDLIILFLAAKVFHL